MTESDGEKAHMLNSFFSSVFTSEDLSEIPDPELKHTGPPLQHIIIEEEEVMKRLGNLKPAESPGPDGLHPRALKEAAELIAKPLTLVIFNKSIEEGVVPDDWKVAHVTALFKKGKTASPGNYRPVSLTSVWYAKSWNRF